MNPGDRLGQYTLIEPIDFGGMGEVWLGREHRTDEVVAIKVLHPHLSNSAAFRQRFEHEVDALARMHHPNIVSLIDVIRQPCLALVMEFIDAVTLVERLAEGVATPSQVKQWGRELASALEHAHALGLIHRDIKPANVLIDSLEHAHLADFGIAVLPHHAALTQVGTIIGTAAYLSPEQAMGHTVDQRSDLYSLGLVLFEAVTGSLPHEGFSPVEPANRIQSDFAVEVFQPVARLDPVLGSALQRCLRADPGARWPSAREFGAALSRSPTEPLAVHRSTQHQPTVAAATPATTAFPAPTKPPPAPTPQTPLRQPVGRLVRETRFWNLSSISMMAGAIILAVFIVLRIAAGIALSP